VFFSSIGAITIIINAKCYLRPYRVLLEKKKKIRELRKLIVELILLIIFIVLHVYPLGKRIS